VNTGGARADQQGAASLLIALLLMTVTTMITLAVARTRVSEIHMAANDNHFSRLQLAAWSEWEKARVTLPRRALTLTWLPVAHHRRLLRHNGSTTRTDGIEAMATYHRSANSAGLVDIQVITRLLNGDPLTSRVNQTVLLLTALSPPMEAAPPLVINGCLSGNRANIDIRPRNSDKNNAGDAIWYFGKARCVSFDAVDVHAGRRIRKSLKHAFWPRLFSVRPDEFERLAESEHALRQRYYWWVKPTDLMAGKWTRSLGSSRNPVILIFPRKTGCPQFADGVHIFGFVYIDGDCPEAIANGHVNITGTLAINGNATSGDGHLQLNPIQGSDQKQTRLFFPVLRAVKIPGTWKDFQYEPE